MSCLIGIRAKTFALVVSDKNPNLGLLTHTQDLSKTIHLPNTAICYSGPVSEADRLLSLAKEKILFECTKHNLEISPKICKNIISEIVYNSLRRRQIGVGTVILGKQTLHSDSSNSGSSIDSKTNTVYEMYIADEYGAICEAKYACLGYAKLFGYGLLDNLYSEDMTVEQGLAAVKKVVACMRSKMCIGYDRFEISVIDENGTNCLEFKADEMLNN